MKEIDKYIIPYIFFVLIVAYIGNIILVPLLIIVTLILIIKIPTRLKHEIIQNFKNEHIIFKILVTLLIIVAIYELITVKTIKGLTAIVTLTLLIYRTIQDIKKEEE